MIKAVNFLTIIRIRASVHVTFCTERFHDNSKSEIANENGILDGVSCQANLTDVDVDIITTDLRQQL